MSKHIHAHEHPESETDRGGGFTLWFTGLSGSGKTTIAHLVGPELDRRGLATLNDAGAVILFAAPGFYHGPETIDDLVDFLVARCLDQIGIDNALAKRWGDA